MKRISCCFRLLVLGILIVLVSGCGMALPKTPKVIADWSRGKNLGQTRNNLPVSVVWQDESIYLTWVAQNEAAIHFMALDTMGNTLVELDLPLTTQRPREPHLFPAGVGELHLLYLDNPKIPRAVFYTHLSRNGDILVQPVRISTLDVEAESVVAAPGPDGELDVFWTTEDKSTGGLYHVRVDGLGTVTSDSTLIAPAGGKPHLQVDRQGRIHLVWVQESTLYQNDVYYAVFDPATGLLYARTLVGRFSTGTGLIAYGPVLGLDNQNAYVFWALEKRGGGLTAGGAETWYVTFPLSQPAYREPVRLTIPGAMKPDYQSAKGAFTYERLAYRSPDPGAIYGDTDFLYMPSVVPGQHAELALFLSGKFSTRTHSSVDVVAAYLEAGTLKGYQIAARTSSNSMRPVATADDASNLHLVWISPGGFGRYEVYYASTRTDVKGNFDRRTLSDVVGDLLGSVWSIAPALGFFPPILLVWAFPSFVFVVVYYITQLEGGLDRRGPRVALVIAIGLYLFAKLFLMPSVLFYSPLLDMMPRQYEALAIVAVPLLTFLISCGALVIYYKRSEYPTLFGSYLIFILTDTMLSLLIYVPTMLVS
ncbi:MAG: hypothetical protein H5T64_00220 [Chloroflexi bacterium]|nr:hypothetical protein [Chloroflexota bacterium]